MNRGALPRPPCPRTIVRNQRTPAGALRMLTLVFGSRCTALPGSKRGSPSRGTCALRDTAGVLNTVTQVHDTLRCEEPLRIDRSCHLTDVVSSGQHHAAACVNVRGKDNLGRRGGDLIEHGLDGSWLELAQRCAVCSFSMRLIQVQKRASLDGYAGSIVFFLMMNVTYPLFKIFPREYCLETFSQIRVRKNYFWFRLAIGRGSFDCHLYGKRSAFHDRGLRFLHLLTLR